MSQTKNRLSDEETGIFDRLDLLSSPHNEWVERVKFNCKRGDVNKKLLIVLAELTHWKVEAERKRWYERSKRVFDFFFSLFLLLLSSPVFLACAIAIRLESNGPIFFRQLRAGQFGQPFWIWKFRTMPVTVSEKVRFLRPMEKPKGADVASRVGSFLRNHKLDELPQLWNVLKGDMSILGPRPFSMNDTASIAEEDYIRFAVKPGLTGLWQATVPNDCEGGLKLKLDNEYVRRRGWRLDLALLLLTPLVVIQGENSFRKQDELDKNSAAKLDDSNGRRKTRNLRNRR